MQTVVSKWGNSLAMRIPAPFAAQLHLEANSDIDIELRGESIVITPAKSKRHRRHNKYTLDELLEGITPENRQEAVDWGEPVGKEVFWE